jgi:lipopolysaccharide/colanic/teichoic acid biosynthesis glycosyltransferase
MNMGNKNRIFDLALAIPAFVITLPVMFIIGVLVILGSHGPAVFRQHRVGRRGRIFTFYKIRTMSEDPDAIHLSVTDRQRVTRLGKILRKTKLDELPQLWNVIKGDIGFVGPRPEIPQYVDMEDPMWRKVLESRPGITSPTTIALKNEEELINSARGNHRDFYTHVLVPFKLRSYIRYERSRTLFSDFVVILQTIGVVMFSTLLGVQVFESIEDLKHAVRQSSLEELPEYTDLGFDRGVGESVNS